ncbi:MAG TPA: DNA/RNA helicase domain-containing protein [Bacteroidia bacterium]|jgi:hypothetical protein
MKSRPLVRIAEYSFGPDTIKEIENDKFVKDLWPLIYVLSGIQKKEAYVGESTNAISRIQNHLLNPTRHSLKTLHLITCGYFNKSAALDIESSLIKYMSADGKYKLQNGNAGLVSHNYYQSNLYRELFKTIWSDLRKHKLADLPLRTIDNSDVFKYSPYKALTVDQHEAVIKLLRLLVSNTQSTTSSNSLFVEGSAGTGKTILAVYLIKLLKSYYLPQEKEDLDAVSIEEIELSESLQGKYPKLSIALVIPMTSLRKTLQKVFKGVKGLDSKMVIGPSEVAKNKYDILVVDEAHRLRQRVNITNYKSFDDCNARLGFGANGTELDWIVKQSKHQIFFYDQAQSIKPSDIPKQHFEALKKQSVSPLRLKSQLRVNGGNDYINYIDRLLNCNLGSKSVFKDKNYEFTLFDSLKQLQTQLKKKEAQFGLCRLVAGYSWRWKSKTKNTTDINIEGLKFKWNSTNKDWINSDNSVNEVGCIHTTQGYDLNYTGLIFGDEISYDLTLNKIIIKAENYFDIKGKSGIKNPEELNEYILNIYKTLLFRGIKGTYVYVCDDKLRAYFRKHIFRKTR